MQSCGSVVIGVFLYPLRPFAPYSSDLRRGFRLIKSVGIQLSAP
jgi:hypothetical protein